MSAFDENGKFGFAENERTLILLESMSEKLVQIEPRTLLSPTWEVMSVSSFITL